MSDAEPFSNSPVRADPWAQLRRHTPARIALGRAGGSVPTRPLLDFRAAHAQARDAVRAMFRPEEIARTLEGGGVPSIELATVARSRTEYLRRPDLGRRLDESSKEKLAGLALAVDVAIIVSDGLSALASERQAPATVIALWSTLRGLGWTLAPVCIVPFARVKVQDEIGVALGAAFSIILLGERPGLGTPDSLGAYLVARPSIDCTDADRNCLSNIRAEGLPPEIAAKKLVWLLEEARKTGKRGIELKDGGEAEGTGLSI